MEELIQLTIPTPFQVGDVHVYLLKSTSTTTLIDVGPNTDEAWDSLHTQLHAFGMNIEDIDQIVLTHHHPDHVGLLDRFPELPVFGLEGIQRWLVRTDDFYTHYQEALSAWGRQFGVPVSLDAGRALADMMKYSCNRECTNLLQEGDVLPGHLGWEVVTTPGHASNQLALFHLESGRLIAGDALLAHISPNPILEPVEDGSTTRPKPILEHMNTMHKLLSLPLSTVYPGHGEIIEKPIELIEKRLNEQQKREEHVLTHIATSEHTVFSLGVALFPHAYKTQLPLVLSETVGQLDCLETKGRVSVREHEGVFYYKAVEERTNAQ
ncbi:MBL fold metallo-hydrolase [Bacillus fonticola]|uniref:MBL fold metallo-hydrolase n=1 Tax=Bacillus fonticola TaxID=2728853 RepID=UPI001473749D|nr:MBL fold metallo-hydrolase [Bacillus fonticola]